MNDYDISVIFAHHSSAEDGPAESPSFQELDFPAERIQWLPVFDDDIYHPRANALGKFAEARGRFTILLDEQDLFAPPLLSDLLRLLEETEELFAMPALRFPPVKRTPEYFAPQRSIDEIIHFSENTEEDGFPTVIPTELHGLLFRTEALREAFAHVASETEPEKQVLLYLLRKRPSFLYAGTCSLRYGYPRECDYQYDFRCMTHEWYYDPFEKFLLPAMEQELRQSGRVSTMLQCLALYMIHIRIFANTNNRNKGVITPPEVPGYIALFSRVLQYVDTRTIVSRECRTSHSSSTNRLMDLHMKKQDFSYRPKLTLRENLSDKERESILRGRARSQERAAREGRISKTPPELHPLYLTCDGEVFSGFPTLSLEINLIDYKNGCLEIDGAIGDFFHDRDGSIFANFDGRDYPLTYNHRYSMSKCFGVTYARLKTFHVSIPVPPPDKERILRFMLHTGGEKLQLDYAFPSHTSRFAKDFPYMLWQFGEYAAFWNDAGIHIRRSTPALVLYKQVRLWLQMWKRRKGHRRQIPLKVLNFLMRPYFSRQTIWLFFDKIYKGGDSSEYIYRYAAAKDDGIKKYYLLDPESADYKRMRKEGYRPLRRGSLKHRLIFLNASMVIASNSTVFAFNDYNFRKTLPIRGDIHFDVACVQHGMSIQKIALAQQRLRDNTKLYFCASKYEIENLSKPVYDYAGYDALKLTGVPRYDGLKSRARKILLLSPTWRMNSAMPVFKNEGVARDYNPNFRETSYYKVYNSLINDPRLLSAARKYGYRIQYVLHPIVSPQYDDFTQNDSVEIISAIGDMSYEKLFCEAALMVTDFSGVQFDFAYMRKPVVYLHHNDIPQHYEEGTFHYTTMGFGEICHTNDELIDVLCRYMQNDCVMPEVYRRRADDFFAFSDNNNCERIYPIMLEHERQRTRQGGTHH